MSKRTSRWGVRCSRKTSSAKLEFETVLQFQNLPLDLADSSRDLTTGRQNGIFDGGERLAHFSYAETGFGGYRTNSTRGSTGGDQDSTFFNARVGGGIDYLFGNGYAHGRQPGLPVPPSRRLWRAQ